MSALRDLVGLVRWSRAQPRPSLGDALATAARATEDARAYQDALAGGVVGPHNGVGRPVSRARVRAVAFSRVGVHPFSGSFSRTDRLLYLTATHGVKSVHPMKR